MHHQRAGSSEAVKQAHIERIEGNLQRVLQLADDTRRHTHALAEELAWEQVLAARAPAIAA